MTLRPTIVSPASVLGRRPKKGAAQQKKMVIDCKHDSQWKAIHSAEVNGVVLRRRPIRAIETYLDMVQIEPQEFVSSQSQLRKKLDKVLVLENEDNELRRKFLMNDILAMSRVLITQAKSRDYLFKICPDLPEEFHMDQGALKMLICYRGIEISFRQPKDKDIRSFEPYGTALFRGQAYEAPVEWYGTTTDERAFYLTIEPYSKRMRR